MVIKLTELLSCQSLKGEWQKRRLIMLNYKIDVTSFWCWFVENYPDSTTETYDKPEFWQRFN